MTDDIRIADAYENNLKHVSLTIPKRKLVVFAGVSGSGMSSLAFDTIAVESSRQWQANYPLFLRNKMPHYERPKVESIENLTPSIVVDQRSAGTSARSTVGTAIDAAPLVRLLFSRCGKPSAGGSMAQESLAWMLSKPGITAPIVGSTSERHIEEAVSALDVTLDPEEIAALEAPYVPHVKSGAF